MRAAQQAPASEARAVHTVLAWATEEQVKLASVLASRFQRRGVVAALGMPLTYLAYLRTKHTNTKGS